MADKTNDPVAALTLMSVAEIGYTYGALGRDFAQVLAELNRLAEQGYVLVNAEGLAAAQAEHVLEPRTSRVHCSCNQWEWVGPFADRHVGFATHILAAIPSVDERSSRDDPGAGTMSTLRVSQSAIAMLLYHRLVARFDVELRHWSRAAGIEMMGTEGPEAETLADLAVKEVESLTEAEIAAVMAELMPRQEQAGGER